MILSKAKSLTFVILALVIAMGAIFPMCTLVAHGGGFVPSISSKGAPEVTKVIDKDGNDVTDRVIITPYVDRKEMGPEKQKDIEKGYDKVDMDDIARQINDGLDPNKKVKPDNLAVTDIFYVHEEHDRNIVKPPVEVTIKYDATPHQLVEVFYFDGNKWIRIPCINNGDGTVTFTVEHWGPYMIVTNTVHEKSGGDAPASPKTGEPRASWVVDALSDVVACFAK